MKEQKVLQNRENKFISQLKKKKSATCGIL